MQNKERIYYIDILKSISIFSVIVIHIFALGNSAKVMNITISYFAEIFKFAVPIFLMITGSLLLNRNYQSNYSFLKKRIKRITIPYLFWIILIILALIIPNGMTSQPEITECIYTTFFNFPLSWYFWLMIGVYFTIPIINEFIKTDQLNSTKYLVIMFVISSILYQLLSFFKAYTYIDLTFFVLPIGYLSLGYFLSGLEFKNKRNVLIISIIIFIITSIIEVLFNQDYNLNLIFANFPAGFTSLLDVSIIRIIQATAVFLFIKNLPLKKFKMKKFFTSISKSCYGIYLVHIFIYLIVFHYVPVKGTGSEIMLLFLSSSVFIFLISWIIVLIMSKIPVLSKFSGYA